MPGLRRCNSSSSLFITSTISAPDEQELLLTIATVIQRLLSSDIDPPNDLLSSSFNPGGVRRSPANPTATEVFEYMEAVQLRAEFSIECSVFVMIYLMRSSVSITKDNWDLLVLTAYLVAQKFWDDTPLRSCEFLYLLNDGRSEYMGRTILNNLEITFLQSVRFNLLVTRDTYTQTYFELMQVIPQENHKKKPFWPITATEGVQLGLAIPGPNSNALVEAEKKVAMGEALGNSMPEMKKLRCPDPLYFWKSRDIAVIS
jgi:hypothetical protein